MLTFEMPFVNVEGLTTVLQGSLRLYRNSLSTYTVMNRNLKLAALLQSLVLFLVPLDENMINSEMLIQLFRKTTGFCAN